jgi:PAS domain S-box-containing protein
VAFPLELISSRVGSLQSPTLLCAVGRDYRFRQHNVAWEFLLGLTPQELRAKSFLDWLHPDDRQLVLDETRRLGTNGEAVSFDARVSSRESRYRRFAWSAFDLKDPQGFYAIGRECAEAEPRQDEVKIRLSTAPDAVLLLCGDHRTALIGSETPALRRILRSEPAGQAVEIVLPLGRRAPVELTLGAPRRTEAPESPARGDARWAAAAEHARDAVIIRGSDDLVTGWNHSAEQLYGYTAAEIIGSSMARLLPPERAADDRRLQARLLRQEEVPAYDTERLRKDGSRIEVSVSAAPLPNGSGTPTQFVEIARDVSTSRREERRRLSEADDLARSNAELKEYGSILSHDLQEPLHALLSYLAEFRSRFGGLVDDDGAELLAFAGDCAEWMRSLTRDLLDHARLSIRPDAVGPTDVDELLDEVLIHLRPQIDQAGARVTRGPLPVVPAHKTRLAQVFQNLISNALKFRGAEPPRIRVEAELRPGETLFRIADNGAGISAERQRHLFRPSLRRDEDDPYPDFGMGLSIAAGVVERHGGRIWVESTLGQGSTFFFTIPASKERG